MTCFDIYLYTPSRSLRAKPHFVAFRKRRWDTMYSVGSDRRNRRTLWPLGSLIHCGASLNGAGMV